MLIHSTLQTMCSEDGTQVERHFEDCCHCVLSMSANLCDWSKVWAHWSSCSSFPPPHPIPTSTLKALKPWSVYVSEDLDHLKQHLDLNTFSGLSPQFKTVSQASSKLEKSELLSKEARHWVKHTWLVCFCSAAVASANDKDELRPPQGPQRLPLDAVGFGPFLRPNN